MCQQTERRNLTRQGRQPTQARAQERVARILTAARGLIAATGSERLRMSDVAAQAGVPIGSLYQYFPDKAALLRALAEDYMQRIRAGVALLLAEVDSIAAARAALLQAMDGYYALFRAEPVVHDIWCGTQADKLTQAMDLEDSRLNADIVFDCLRRFLPETRHAALRDACLLMVHLLGAAVRMAMLMPQAEGDRLMEDYKALAIGHVERLLAGL